jgi:hypothetical protein
MHVGLKLGLSPQGKKYFEDARKRKPEGGRLNDRGMEKMTE